MVDVPKSHPRYLSLLIRENLEHGLENGLVTKMGMIAHGRGEAFDYIIGEKTIEFAERAERAAAATLLLAKKPVFSVNGNACALASKEIVEMCKAANCGIEVNLFYRTEERVKKIADRLREFGAKNVVGEKTDRQIPRLDHARGLSTDDGTYGADVVFLAIEDGDRTEALKKMGKKVIVIDLNPLSRTALAGDITIVDNIVRAIPNVTRHVEKLKGKSEEELRAIAEKFDNARNIEDTLKFMSKRLDEFKAGASASNNIKQESQYPTGAKMSGENDKVLAAVSYIGLWVTGLIIYLLVDKKEKYVRYHAIQAMVIGVAATVGSVILSILQAIPYIGLIFAILNGLFTALVVIAIIICAIKAYKGEKFNIPIASEMAEKNA
ncbi:MAG: 4-phosphopantoate--beta-alanine ligase [Candidatus Thermoplasmatota archaeon]|nr:4-phosphopantoate--beta-alanine ligase [Candidatus Thermoplasmatota archaeon]